VQIASRSRAIDRALPSEKYRMRAIPECRRQSLLDARFERHDFGNANSPPHFLGIKILEALDAYLKSLDTIALLFQRERRSRGPWRQSSTMPCGSLGQRGSPAPAAQESAHVRDDTVDPFGSRQSAMPFANEDEPARASRTVALPLWFQPCIQDAAALLAATRLPIRGTT
jgi:hypothetical protein